MQMFVPDSLELGVLLLKTDLRQYGIGGPERELDLPLAHVADEIRRDAATEPEILAARVFPGCLHSERHV
jgi:hypothetical protein